MDIKKIAGFIAASLFFIGLFVIALFTTGWGLVTAVAIEKEFKLLPWEDANVFIYMGLMIFPTVFLVAHWLKLIIHSEEKLNQ